MWDRYCDPVEGENRSVLVVYLGRRREKHRGMGEEKRYADGNCSNTRGSGR